MCFKHVSLSYSGACFFVFLKEVVQIDRIEKAKVASPGSVNVLISEKEKKLFDILRDIEYGEVVVTMKGGIPVHIEEIKKSIKL